MELMNTRVRIRYNAGNIQVQGLSKKMDVIILAHDNITYNKPLNSAKTIFIKIEFVPFFMDNIFRLINHRVNIIIAGDDITFPNNIDVRYSGFNYSNYAKELIKSKYINKIFVENLDTALPCTYPIPLGVNPVEGSIDLKSFKRYFNINKKKPLKITNFNRVRSGIGQWQERGDVLELCNTVWKKHCIEHTNMSHSLYLKEMGKYLFTICVHGGGLDVNPKLWEALIIGVIPIIIENKPYTNIYRKHDLPVVIVKNWSENNITKKKLKLWRKKYYDYFTNKVKRKEMLKKLKLNYWVKYVSNMKTNEKYYIKLNSYKI